MNHSDQLKLTDKAVHEATYGDKQKHTPEPWQLKGLQDDCVISRDYHPIADFWNTWLVGLKEEAKANAARVVSCINALAGIPDPAKFVAKAKSDATKVVVLSHEINEIHEAVTYCLDNKLTFDTIQMAIELFQDDIDENDPADQADYANKLEKEDF